MKTVKFIFIILFTNTFLFAQIDSVKINSITIVGNNSFSFGELNDLMSTKESSFLVDNYFIEDDFLDDLRIIKKFYNHEGFLNFEVSDYSTNYNEDKSELNISININEGEATTIDSIKIVGNRFLSSTEIKEKLDVHVGDRYREIIIKRGKINIKKIYLNSGFLDVKVEIKAKLNKVEKVVEVTFSIQEKERFTINKIIIEGLESTKESIVKRELGFSENEFISLNVLGESMRKLYKTGLFNSVSIKPVPTSDSSNVKKNILVKLMEDEPGEFEVSVSYGTIEKLSLFSEISYNNILGKAYRARLGGKINNIERSIRPSVTDPWILGIPWSLTLSGELSDRNEPSYDITYINGQIHLFKEFHRRSKFGFTYNQGEGFYSNLAPSLFEDVLPDSLSSEELEFLYNFISGLEVDQTRKSFKITLLLDERDNLFNPYNGYYIDLSTEYITGSSSVDTFKVLSSKVYNNILRSEVTGKYFISFSKQTTIVSSLNIGIIKNFSKDEAIFLIDDLFYTGGPNTMRGFGYKLVGPLTSNNDPTGGLLIVVWNIFEIRQRIFSVFSGVLFADIGNIWAKPEDFSFNSFRYSAGFGLRIDSPIGLVRFDYGFNLLQKSGESSGEFWFGIGHTF